jgi:hypothetical protein
MTVPGEKILGKTRFPLSHRTVEAETTYLIHQIHPSGRFRVVFRSYFDAIQDRKQSVPVDESSMNGRAKIIERPKIEFTG